MSDYCKQCSIELFGEDLKELAGLITPQEVKKGYGASVLCEGCGPTIVDHKGKCIWIGCDKHGKRKDKRHERKGGVSGPGRHNQQLPRVAE